MLKRCDIVSLDDLGEAARRGSSPGESAENE